MPEPTARPVLDIASMAAGAILGLTALALAFGDEQTAFEDLALGAATLGVYAQIEGAPIHCRGVDDATGCIEGFRARSGGGLTLWLGNSQVHGVNGLREGQEAAPSALFRHLHRQGGDLLTFSQPNANLQEHLLLFSYLRARLPVEQLILPVVFDDLRESGLRSSLLPALEDAATRAALDAHEVGRRIMEDHADMAAGDLAALDETVQEHSEAALNAWLGDHSSLWKLRPEARGQLFSKLYLLRNQVLGIDAQSVRKLIPGRYAINLAAGRAILADARDSGIEVLVYIVPLRSDVKVPYDLGEYARFQEEIEGLAAEYGAAFANLGTLIPAQHWGMTSSARLTGTEEIDFMHFQASGHALLADALGELLDEHFPGAGS